MLPWNSLLDRLRAGRGGLHGHCQRRIRIELA